MSYSGQPQLHEAPEDMLFGENLEEFAQRVSLVVGLEASGKITADEAYKRIKSLWKQVKSSRKSLGVGKEPPAPGAPETPGTDDPGFG